MKQLPIVLAVLAICAIPAYAVLRQGYLISDEEVFVQACERVLMPRLKSPSSYERISTTGLQKTTATFGDANGWFNAEKRGADQSAARQSRDIRDMQKTRREIFAANGYPWMVGTIISYDAANSFGTRIRGTAGCQVIVWNMDELRPVSKDGSSVMIDGYTEFDWRLRSLRN